MTVTDTGLALSYRLHREPAAAGIAGICGHQARIRTDPAGAVAALFRVGARHVRLDTPVDLTADADGMASARALVVLRELASWAIEADWRLRADASTDLGPLMHLGPPADCAGASGQLDAWRASFFFGACVCRRGPGFLQVRDRRSGELSRFTIDDPGYLAVADAALGGARADDLDAEVIADFESEGLVGRVGGHVWWIPCRIRRWPIPAMAI
jgi:Family of unknown function (DUF5825)